MPLTTLEVVDTAVKIGLGGLISGAVALAAIQLNARNEWRKVKRLHRLEAIKELSADIQRNVSVVHDGHAKLYAFVMAGAEKGATQHVLQLGQEFNETREAHYSGIRDLYRCCAQLEIIGGKDGSTILRQYTKALNETTRGFGYPDTIDGFKAAKAKWDEGTAKHAMLNQEVRSMLNRYFEAL